MALVLMATVPFSCCTALHDNPLYHKFNAGDQAVKPHAVGRVSADLQSSRFLKGINLPSQSQLSKHAQLPPGKLQCRAAVAADNSASAAETKKITLGQTDVEIPVLGIGTWSWGDKFTWNDGEWDDRKMKDAKFAFEASMNSGLGLFDTAEVYGTKQFGGEDSEKLLGRFIRERGQSQGDRPLVATKYAALPWRLGRQSVVSTLKESLEKLGLPQVDLYQLHWPGLWGNQGYIDGLADCVEQGLTRAVGVSNYSEKRLREAHAQLAARGVPLASNQVHYSLLYRLPEENGVKAACEELGITLIAYSPLAQGILSGKYTPENRPTGPRANSYSVDFLTKASPLLTRLKELGAKYGKSSIQVSLNWLIAQGGVVPIPGAKNKTQAEEFAGALGWSLTPEEVQELRQLAAGVPKVQGFPVEAW